MKGIVIMGISTRITVFLMGQGIISAEDKEIYEYGFDLLIADFINFSCMLMIGGGTNRFWQTITYIILFVGLRSVCGGYHAKTHLRCHICTIGAFLSFLLLLNVDILENNELLVPVGNFLAVILVILFAPIPHADKPLSQSVYKRNRIAAITLFFFLAGLSIGLRYLNKFEQSNVISLTLWIVALAMIPAIDIHLWIKRRKEHEEHDL